MLKHVNYDNFEMEVIKSSKAVLVDFFATWCGPCQMLGPVLEKISESRTDFDIAKVDIDENEELASGYGIEVVPTIIIFKNGELVKKVEGYHSEKEIIDIMSEFI